jgi:tetratricopeptide (TPR) repeat protein
MWSERFLSVLAGDQPALLSRLHAHLSSNFLEHGHSVRAMELAERAVELARASGDDETLAWALKESAGAAIDLGRLEDAEAHLTEAGAIQGVEAFLRLRLLRLRGLLKEARGDHEAAIATFDEVIKEARLRNDYVVEQRASRHVAVSEHHRGRTENALTIAREMLSKLRSGADTEELARWLRYFAVFLAARDNLSEAAAAAREATQLFALQGFESANLTAALEVLALVYALQGNLARAAALEGYSQVAFRREPFQRDTAATETHERLIVILRDGLAPDELEQLLAKGAGFMPEEALALALNDG